MNPSDPKTFFPKALEHVLKKEGGYVDNPHDDGGATNYGITTKSLSRWRRCPVTKEDIKALGMEEVFLIYKANYWDICGLNWITQYPIALAIFDSGVLFGTGASRISAQKALNLSGFPEIKVDGVMGPKTLSALNCADPEEFLKNFHAIFLKRIAAIIAHDPEDQWFRIGWENRIKEYLAFAERKDGPLGTV